MPVTTRLLIEQDIVRHLNKLDPTLANLPVPLLVTTAGPDTTTLIATTLGRGTRDANAYDGRQIKVMTKPDSGSGAAKGRIAGVLDGTFVSNDRVTLRPALDAALSITTSGQEVMLLARGLAPEDVLDALNAVVRETDVPQVGFPSLVRNAHFEEELVLGTTLSTALLPNGWTAVGTPAGYAVFGQTRQSGFLAQKALFVDTDDVDEGVQTPSFAVHQGEQITVSLFIQAGITAGNICTVTLRDLTAGAAVKTVLVDEDRSLVEVRFTATVPSGCLAMAVRVTAAVASTSVFAAFTIHAPVIVQSLSGRLYESPPGLEREEQVAGQFVLPQGVAIGGETDQFVPFSGAPQEASALPSYRSASAPAYSVTISTAAGPHQVVISAATEGPIGIAYNAPGYQLTNVDPAQDFTFLDREWLVEAAVARLLRQRGDPSARDWTRRAASRALALGYSEQGIRFEPNPSRMMGSRSPAAQR